MGIVRSCLHLLLWSLVGLSGPALAAEDTAGSRDHPLLSRYPNSHIVDYEQNYNAAQFATGTQDGVSQRQTVEGDATQIRYFHSAVDNQPSPLQLLRNYTAETAAQWADPRQPLGATSLPRICVRAVAVSAAQGPAWCGG